jgi:hypothetical protein
MSLNNKAFDKLEKELDIESNFNRVFINSFKYDTINKKQIKKIIICFCMIFILSYPIALSNDTMHFILSLTDVGVNFSVGIIGFLITGFALYAGLLENKRRYVLILTKDPKKNINMYKSNILLFFKSFGIFLIVLGVSIFGKYGIEIYSTSSLVKYFNSVDYKNIIISIVISIFLSVILIGIITLKVFIYNIYSSMMSMGKDELYYRHMSIDDYIKYLEDEKNSE